VLLGIGLLVYLIFKYLIDVMPDYDDEEDWWTSNYLKGSP
jgi:hypothetical protein